MCFQATLNPYLAEILSENCLTLNLYRPQNATNLPILIYLHDGYFLSGEIFSFDGSILAQATNSIVIAIQGRLKIIIFRNFSGFKEPKFQVFAIIYFPHFSGVS